MAAIWPFHFLTAGDVAKGHTPTNFVQPEMLYASGVTGKAI